MRPLRPVATIAVITLALLSACGGGGGGGGKQQHTSTGAAVTAAPAAEVDTTTLGTALSEWTLNTAKPKYPDISPPIWSGGADNAVLAFLPAGAEPVSFCQELNDYLTETVGAGFDAVSIRVIKDMSTPEALATSAAGAACTA